MQYRVYNFATPADEISQAAATRTTTDDLDGLKGDGGADFLSGGRGSDTLHGGAGKDKFTAGKGGDVFVFVSGDGVDKIKDFDARKGMHDVINLNQLGDDVVVNTVAGDKLAVLDMDLGDLDKGDFSWLLVS